MAMLRGDLGIAHVSLVMQQRMHDLARTLRREAPIGGEGHHEKLGLCGSKGSVQVAVELARGVEIIQRLGHQQVGVRIEIGSELVTLIAQVGLDLELDVLRRVAEAAIAQLAPELSVDVEELKDWKQVSFLSVSSDRLTRWYKPGLLMIGDAAHVMSPAGGNGINYAIMDAVAAANRPATVPNLTILATNRNSA